MHFAKNTQLETRVAFLSDFLSRMLEKNEHPFFISDEATIFDISGEMPEEILLQIEKNFDVHLNEQQLAQPLWMLLDIIYAHRVDA
jgi:hypothetical protein